MSTPSPESVPEDVRKFVARVLESSEYYYRRWLEHEGPEEAVALLPPRLTRLDELEHYHNHFRSHAKVSPSGAKAYDTAKEDWEKRMKEA